MRTVGEIYAEQRRKGVTASASTEPNPFAAATRNMTRMNLLIRRDPTLARRLCEQAGENWRTYVPYPDTVAGEDLRRREQQDAFRRNFG